MSVSVLVAPDTKSYRDFRRIIAQAAPRLNVMDLQTLDAPAGLAAPAVPLRDLAGKLPLSFSV